MLTNILVPLDGSDVAEAALPYARTIAQRTGARLTLVRAVSGSNATKVIAEAEDYLLRLAVDLSRDGFNVETGVPFGGDPAQWIVEESEIRRADLIVMASHDRAGVDRLVHGSVAERVVHGASVPIMVVKGTAGPDVAQRLALPQPVLIVPLDGSHLAESVLPTAKQLAVAIGGRIVLFSVVPVQAPLVIVPSEVQATFSEAEYSTIESDSRQYLEELASPVRASGIAVDAVVRIGEAGLEIASLAQQYSAAAVVMATHGRTGIVRSMLGSVAGAVAHCGNTPVVLVHPFTVRGAEQAVGRLAVEAPLS